jgi:DNA polymerase-3 subunit delta
MPTLLLYGTDEFAITRRISEIAAKTDRDGMNTSRFEARLTNDTDLNNAVNSMPFLAEKRLVILANPSQNYSTPDARKKFMAFLENVPSTTLLVMNESVEYKEAEKHWLVKWSAKNEGAKSEALMAPRAKEMTGWILAEAKRQNGEIHPAAAAKLAEMVGEEPRQAAQEIAKLLTYVNWARPITVPDVEAVSVNTAEVDIFAFVDSLAAGSGQQSQSMLHKMLEDQDAFAIFPMIIRQFRLLIQAREIVDQRGMVQDVIEALHVHPFVAEKTFKQANRFPMKSLEAIYRRLLKMDEAAKTSAVPLDLSLEMFVVELTK